MTDLLEVRKTLRTNIPFVAVESPAGCGKTHEAASLAIEESRRLRPGQEILLLAHTNAAVQEFRRRTRGQVKSVRASTLDAFALELIRPYSSALGLLEPVRMDGPNALGFSELASHACALFRRAPSIAAAIAGHYPLIVLDEHQDARMEQHDLVRLLLATGRTRVRAFGDPMQAILGFEGGLVPWQSVAAEADAVIDLEEPHRWTRTNAELGRWISGARSALREGRSLPRPTTPCGIKVIRLSELPDMANLNSVVPILAVGHPIRRSMSPTGATAVLTTTNAHAVGLRRALGRSMEVEEGSDFTLSYDLLRQAQHAAGNPAALAHLVIDALQQTSSGCDQATRAQFHRCLKEGHVDFARQNRFLPFLRELEKLYVRPEVQTWCEVLFTVSRNPPQGVVIDLPGTFELLGRLRLSAAADALDILDDAARRRRERTAEGNRITTVYKAKGREFASVIVPYCTRALFKDSMQARMLLYVAISRAQAAVTILTSQTHPSPLLADWD